MYNVTCYGSNCGSVRKARPLTKPPIIRDVLWELFNTLVGNFFKVVRKGTCN